MSCISIFIFDNIFAFTSANELSEPRYASGAAWGENACVGLLFTDPECAQRSLGCMQSQAALLEIISSSGRLLYLAACKSSVLHSVAVQNCQRRCILPLGPFLCACDGLLLTSPACFAACLKHAVACESIANQMQFIILAPPCD